MSEKLGPISYSSSGEVFLGRDYGHSKNYSESTANAIDEEVKSIITNAYKRTEDILNAQMPKLDELADYLMKFEKIDGEKFKQLMEGTLVVEEEKPEEAAEEVAETVEEATETTEE